MEIFISLSGWAMLLFLIAQGFFTLQPNEANMLIFLVNTGER